MRLKADVSAERLTFLRQLFIAEPKLTVRGAQGRLRARFGQAMYPGSVLRVRREVLTGAPGSATIPALPSKGKR